MSKGKISAAATNKPAPPDAAAGDFDLLVTSIVQIHHDTQAFATKAVNVALTLRNWLIGYHIVEFELKGKDRAAYGEGLIESLAVRLVSRGLTRVIPRELRRYRQLYQVYPQIWASLAPKSPAQQGFGPLLNLQHLLPLLSPPSMSMPIRESVTPESQMTETATPQLIHHLSFTHLAEIIQLPDDIQRRFYEIECVRGNWSVRELRRQIASLYYQRSGLSKDKDFLYYFISTPSSQSYFMDKAAGSDVQKLNVNIIKALSVCFPLSAEQQRNANCLTTLDDLMTDLHPLLVKGAGGRNISGLSAYE